MIAADNWTFEDAGIVRVPDDSTLGQGIATGATAGSGLTTGTTAAAPTGAAGWVSAIANAAQAGANIYASIKTTQLEQQALRRMTPAQPQIIYQQAPAQVAPLSSGLPPWAIYTMIGVGVLALGLVAYIVLKK